MKREVIKTGDGSTTLHVPELQQHYHSIHGAIQESKHVFIRMGFDEIVSSRDSISVFEMGFGTGLNALLSSLAAEKKGVGVFYESIEAFPLSREEWEGMNYSNQIGGEDAGLLFEKIQTTPWEEPTAITKKFILKKSAVRLADFTSIPKFDLVYFDAFAPRVQPELWTPKVFRKIHNLMIPGGILTTYCAKGDVRRAMQTAGFNVERLEGPPGKREMLRAVKK